MLKKRFFLLLLVIAFMAAACAVPQRHVAPNPASPVYTVAVLPIYNASNDVEGPQKVRELVEKRLAGWQYKVLPLNEVDQVLRDQMGITLGAQLDMTTPQKLGETLGVDGVIYGYLINFDDVTSGVYNVKKVRAGFKLVETRTGRVLWSRGQGVKSEIRSQDTLGRGVSALADIKDVKAGADVNIPGAKDIPGIGKWHMMMVQEEKDIKNAAIMSLGQKIVGKALGVHLRPETDEMLNLVFADFVAGRGAPGAAPQPAVAVTMPAVKAPKMNYGGGPLMGYYAGEKRDFIADTVVDNFDKTENRHVVIPGMMAKLGGNFRSDADLTGIMKEESQKMPQGFTRMSFILQSGKEGERSGYTVYPDLKKYMEMDLAETKLNKPPHVEKKKVGEEKVGNHPCDKFEVKYTTDEGEVFTGFIWEARDLGRFVVKAEYETERFRSVIELKNVRLVHPDRVLFQIPEGYEKAASFMDLFTGPQPAGKEK